MRKVSDQLNKLNPVLTLNEGKWQGYLSQQRSLQNLQKFAGLLYLQDNNEQKILYQIKDIKFSNLVKLSLQSNNIESIEPIQLLIGPKLIQLQLGDNKITNIKSLRKAKFEDLKVLSLRKNMIIQIDCLHEFTAILRHLIVEWCDDYAFCSDINWSFKLESFQLKTLMVESKSRIIQYGVFKKLRNKYPLVQISYNKYKNSN